jgi:hypothetical protein
MDDFRANPDFELILNGMNMHRYLVERLENDWIARCDTRLCELNHKSIQMDGNRELWTEN